VTTVVDARGLTKDFGRLRALDALELTIESGEVFGYLGPNGAGKTTTIRLLVLAHLHGAVAFAVGAFTGRRSP
jgi:ABC-2 type transport system ATP-binding protein